VIYSAGHSVQTAEAFVTLLREYGVRQVADIRSMPRSRRHPHFSKAALEAFLQVHEISYQHFPALGGLRVPRDDSPNTALNEAAFRGYADHMDTPIFRAGVEALLAWAGQAPTVMMCAEADWRDCHRQLLADALVARGIEVVHIRPGVRANPHRLNEFARISGETVRYPGLL
jgi:uncharacterized protein (DUF488 family)